jgi:hypothetical protein
MNFNNFNKVTHKEFNGMPENKLWIVSKQFNEQLITITSCTAVNIKKLSPEKMHRIIQ